MPTAKHCKFAIAVGHSQVGFYGREHCTESYCLLPVKWNRSIVSVRQQKPVIWTYCYYSTPLYLAEVADSTIVYWYNYHLSKSTNGWKFSSIRGVPSIFALVGTYYYLYNIPSSKCVMWYQRNIVSVNSQSSTTRTYKDLSRNRK